jgi:hypothetical protein
MLHPQRIGAKRWRDQRLRRYFFDLCAPAAGFVAAAVPFDDFAAGAAGAVAFAFTTAVPWP